MPKQSLTYKSMKLFKSLFIGITFFLLVLSCGKDDANCTPTPVVSSAICIDSNLISDSTYCIEIYDPVCGCDGLTYSNSCYADRSGVTSYVGGECCD